MSDKIGTQIKVRLYPQCELQLRELAERYGFSMTALIRFAVEQGLPALTKTLEEKYQSPTPSGQGSTQCQKVSSCSNVYEPPQIP